MKKVKLSPQHQVAKYLQTYVTKSFKIGFDTDSAVGGGDQARWRQASLKKEMDSSYGRVNKIQG